MTRRSTAPASVVVRVPLHVIGMPVPGTERCLGPSHVLLLGVLAWHSTMRDGQCHPSERRLADLLAISDRHVRGLLADLVAAGLVTIEPVSGRSSIYRLTPELEFQGGSVVPGSEAPTPELQFRTPRNSSSGHPGTAVPTSIKEGVLNLNRRERRSALSSGSRGRPSRAAEASCDPRVQEVVAYYRERMAPGAGWSAETKVGSKARATHVLDRLNEGYTVAAIKQSIDVIADSQWHRANGHADLELCCRAAKIDAAQQIVSAPAPRPAANHNGRSAPLEPRGPAYRELPL